MMGFFPRHAHIDTVLDIYIYHGQTWNSVVQHLTEYSVFSVFSLLSTLNFSFSTIVIL